ncbi:hypothetical protein KCP69_03755 [Salmonella enterica subsp. enterica]|nr:hypothetical protein KCP69_03755 [Salmonella enterica subsp. enterica]
MKWARRYYYRHAGRRLGGTIRRRRYLRGAWRKGRWWYVRRSAVIAFRLALAAVVDVDGRAGRFARWMGAGDGFR